MDLEYRFASHDDVPELAEMNQSLICDEGHRNTMTGPQLAERMAGWLRGEYKAVIFSRKSETVGYALYRKDPEWIYLRQLFVKASLRRKGIGHDAIAWLKQNAWKGEPIIRIEVLVNNAAGIAFWKAAGFRDYCMTMEMDNK